MNQWYWSKGKQVFGPVEKGEIISLIQNKKLVHLDMLYRDKASGWKPLFQIDEFAHYLGDRKASSGFSGMVMEWVLLKKVKVKKGIEYKQIGPFSVDQVLGMLDSGDLGFDDLAWKKDFESWVPISQLEPFKKPLPSSPVIDSNLYKTTTDQKNLEEISLTSGDIDRYFHEPEMTKTAPINSENFVTESLINPLPSSSEKTSNGKPAFRGDSDFYSMEFTGKSKSLKLKNKVPLHESRRESNNQKENKKQTNQKRPEKKQIKQQQIKYELQETNIKTSGTNKIKEKERGRKTIDTNRLNILNGNKILKLDTDTWQWLALAVVFIIFLIMFFYLLF